MMSNSTETFTEKLKRQQEEQAQELLNHARQTLMPLKCVFHGKAATDYTAKLPPISHESCHPLHGKAATPKEVDNRRV